MSGYQRTTTRAGRASETASGFRIEGVQGRPYNLFTARGIMALSLTSSFLAMLSLVIAA